MRVSHLLAALVLAAFTKGASGEAPHQDELMGLVPRDAVVVLVLDHFRDRSREVLKSDLVRKLASLPSVRSWLDSDQGKDLVKAKAEIKSSLGLSLQQIRDDILGDSAVLVLQMKTGGGADDASGLFLARPRDRAILLGLIAALNKSEKSAGVLQEVVSLPRIGDGPEIFHRKFNAQAKPEEWYCIFPDGTFAWSNSESLIRGVAGRKARGDGLRDSPRYRKIRDALPSNAIVRLYVDPAIVFALVKGSLPPNPQLADALNGLDYLGAAVEWREGPIVHFNESFDLDRLPAMLRPRPSGEGVPADILSRIPQTAIAVAAWRWDLPFTFDVLMSLIPDADRPRAEATQTALQGMLLGKDPRREILPALKPGGVAFVDVPEARGLPTFTASVDVANRPEVSEALENGIRTLAALASLDKAHKGGPIRVESVTRDAIRVSRLIGGSQSVSFASTAKQFVIGTDEAGLSQFLTKAPPPSPSDGLIARLRAAHFARCDGFLAFDLAALHRYAVANRETLVRREVEKRGGNAPDADRDFQRALDLLEPFGGAFATWDVADGGRSAHQAIGLIGRAGFKPR